MNSIFIIGHKKTLVGRFVARSLVNPQLSFTVCFGSGYQNILGSLKILCLTGPGLKLIDKKTNHEA